MPRARLNTSDGKTTEWKSRSLRAYQRRTRAADALIAGAYLAGTNTPVKTAVGEILMRHDLDVFSIMDEAIRRRLVDLEKIERMVASKESCRSNAYRDLELYRESKRFHDEIKNQAALKQLPSPSPKQAPEGMAKQPEIASGAEGDVQSDH